MMDADIRRVVEETVTARLRNERRLLLAILSAVALFGGLVLQVSSTPSFFVGHTYSVDMHNLADRPVGRKLQDLEAPKGSQIDAEAEEMLASSSLIEDEMSDLLYFSTTADSEEEIAASPTAEAVTDIARPPAQQDEEEVLAADILASIGLAPSPETEFFSPDSEMSSIAQTTANAHNVYAGASDTTHADCSCPPGPQGPPGESAPAFLSDLLSFDEDRQVLTINAGTVEMTGSIVVRGYLGVENSLFVGGDPSNGENAAELSPGSLLLYGKNGGDIAGFGVDADRGFKLTNVTVMGALFENNNEDGRPRRVATRLFNNNAP